jgi:hypothetical protein
MKDLTTIERAIYGWEQLVLPSVPMIWFHQNAPRPTVPYVAMHLKTISSKGVDVYIAKTDELVGNRDFILMIQGFGSGSQGFMEALKTSLEKPAIQLYLSMHDLVFVDRMGVNDISEVVDSRWEERNQLDIIMRFAQVAADTEPKIEHVNIEKDFYCPDSSTITVENILVESGT